MTSGSNSGFSSNTISQNEIIVDQPILTNIKNIQNISEKIHFIHHMTLKY